MPDPMPLAGIWVAEFGHTILGPSCGMILADLGAEVIKVEPPEGDRTRRLKGFGTGYFGFFNRNKRSLALDLKSSAGKAAALRRADRELRPRHHGAARPRPWRGVGGQSEAHLLLAQGLPVRAL